MRQDKQQHWIGRTIRALGVAGLWLLAAAWPAAAQEFSRDGNRWYEIEVMVFSRPMPAGSEGERFIPDKIRPAYPRSLRRLTPVIDDYRVPFESDEPPGREDGRRPASGRPSLPSSDFPGTQSAGAGTEVVGPQYSPATGDFRLRDPAEDPFIALGPRHQEFTAMLSRLTQADEHRVLYHGVWRQPALNRPQSDAVFVRGGQRRGEHNELEGSVMLSINGNQLTFDANLWLIRFGTRSRGLAFESPWEVPPQPFPPEGGEVPETSADSDATVQEEQERPPEDDEAAGRYAGLGRWQGPVPARDDRLPRSPLRQPSYVIEEIAQMRQARPLRGGSTHYLDHPAFGVVVEVRSYKLPDVLDDSDQ